MKSQYTHESGRLCFLIVLSLVMGVLMGCQDREVSMSIVSVKPFDIETCEVIEDDNVFQVSGVVDLAMRQTYRANLLLENNLVDVPNAKGLRPADTRVSLNAIALSSAVIEYSTLDQLSTGIPSRRIVPLSGTIPEETALTLANFELFSQDVLQQVRNAEEFFSVNNGEVVPSRTAVTILARVRIKGRTLDGRDAESNEFLFPVEVCNGCRVIYPSEMIVQRGGQLACPAPMVNAEEDNSTATNELCEALLGSDESFVDCQTCQGLAVDSFARQLCQPPRIP
ncbi:MAG: hypothetical protein VYA30_03145 [Myxococcota bacterium]|nr:hypothetical protein [Myxococcota bacterium]